MQNCQDISRRTRAVRGAVVVSFFLMILLQTTGCPYLILLYGDCALSLSVRAKVVEGDAMGGVVDAGVGARSFTDGEETAHIGALAFKVPQQAPAPDGTVELSLSTSFMSCRDPRLELPRPDQIEITVVRDACEALFDDGNEDGGPCDPVRVQCSCVQRFLVEVNDQTADYLEPEADGDPVVVLKEPIIVPPCEECCAFLLVRGRVLDAQTLTGFTEAGVGGESYTDGIRTGSVFSLFGKDGAHFSAPDEDGAFWVTFATVVGCGSEDRFPRADHVRISVSMEGCAKGFAIDISEETAVFLDESQDATPLDVIELKEPILVPPCGE